jgi:nucleotide-binding universal stress UspA family protein
MQRFMNILVVMDKKTDSEALIERAVALSQRNQARLTFVNVLDELPRDIPAPVAVEPVDVGAPSIDIIEELPPDIPAQVESDPVGDHVPINYSKDPLSDEASTQVTQESPLDIREQIIEAEVNHLDQIVSSIQQAGVQASSKVLYGTPFLEIIREVLRNGHDLVMIAAEGRGSLREMLFGSTTMRLMRQCPCPVWVIKPLQFKRYACILVAVDPTPEDEERNALNIKVLDLATYLAQLEQSELLIIHAWNFSVEDSLRRRSIRIPENQIDEWARGVQDLHRRRLCTLLEQYDLERLKHQVYLLKGEADRLIPKLVKAKDVELIVMGTVVQTGIAGLFIGGTAAKVLRQVDCSVLTVKPDGFKTPVKFDE